jgi:hypothetical protein
VLFDLPEAEGQRVIDVIHDEAVASGSGDMEIRTLEVHESAIFSDYLASH